MRFWPPVTQGAYECVSATLDRTVWRRLEDWWGNKHWGKPAPKYIILRYKVNYGTQLLDLARSRIDFVLGIKSKSDCELVRFQNPNFHTFILPPVYPDVMAIDINKYPWNTTETRHALSLIVDRQRMNDITLEGLGLDFIPFALGVHKPYYQAMAEHGLHLKGKDNMFTEKNLEKAASILTALNFNKTSDGFWYTPKGTRLRLDITYPIGWNPFFEMCPKVFAAELRSFGIETSLTPMPGSAFVQATFRGKLACGPWFLRARWDPYEVFEAYHSKNLRPSGESMGRHNPYRWYNHEFDALVDQLSTVPYDMTNPRSKQLYYEVSNIFFREWLFIPLLMEPQVSGYTETYWTGWGPYTFAGYPVEACALQKAPSPTQSTGTTPTATASRLFILGIGAVIVILLVVRIVLFLRKRRT